MGCRWSFIRFFSSLALQRTPKRLVFRPRLSSLRAQLSDGRLQLSDLRLQLLDGIAKRDVRSLRSGRCLRVPCAQACDCYQDQRAWTH